MGIGWIVSLSIGGIISAVYVAIAISLDRKYIVRENGKINYKKSTIFLRWNVLDTLILFLSIYTILCVQALNMLVSSGQTVENPFVQFFTNQSQVWVTVDILYLVIRVSNTMKAIKAHWGDELDDKQ